jgi:type IV pilus assembly protein PilM
VIVVNVGARTTSLLFLEGDRFYVRTLALAGNSVTQAIADELRIDFASAETLKIQVLSGKSDLPAASPSRGAVQRSAASFITKLQLEITRSAVNHRRHSGSSAAVAVYLTGGGSLIDELPAALAERLRLPVERYQPFKNVDISADARASGAEASAQVLADLVGMATCLINKAEVEASLLPPALTATLAFRKRQPVFMAAAVLVVLALVPPIAYLHSITTATLERVSQVDGQLMPLRAVEHRNSENLRRIEAATKQIAALRAAYETKSNWINFLADLQERLVKIEDVWLDKLQVVRPALPEPGEQAVVEGGQEQPAAGASGQVAAESGQAKGDTRQAAADATATPDAVPAAAEPVPAVVDRPPVRLTLSGRLLDVANPQSKVSPESLQRVKQLLASFTGSQFIGAVENERFDTNQNGLLKFDFTLVINPKKTL